MAFVANELKLSVDDVELLLVELILDKRIFGKIDQINGFLLLNGESNSIASKKYDAIDKWTATLESLSTNLTSKISV